MLASEYLPVNGGVADTVIANETGLLVKSSADSIARAITALTMDGIKGPALGKRTWTRGAGDELESLCCGDRLFDAAERCAT